MKQLTLLLCIAILTNSCGMNPAKNNKKSVLIYTWSGEGYVHDNIKASVAALETICTSMGVETTLADTPSVWDESDLTAFDGIIFSNTNKQAFTSQSQRDAFRQFLLSGKGFAGIHSANTSEPGWEWFRNMMGGTFLRHPELQPFGIRVIDPGHISTRHLPETWEWEDEPYYSHYFNPGIHILLAADLGTIEDGKKDDYPGTAFGDYMPLAWCHETDGSRVWFTALGHKIEYYQDPLFREHLEGGIRWMLNLE